MADLTTPSMAKLMDQYRVFIVALEMATTNGLSAEVIEDREATVHRVRAEIDRRLAAVDQVVGRDATVRQALDGTRTASDG